MILPTRANRVSRDMDISMTDSDKEGDSWERVINSQDIRSMIQSQLPIPELREPPNKLSIKEYYTRVREVISKVTFVNYYTKLNFLIKSVKPMHRDYFQDYFDDVLDQEKFDLEGLPLFDRCLEALVEVSPPFHIAVLQSFILTAQAPHFYMNPSRYFSFWTSRLTVAFRSANYPHSFLRMVYFALKDVFGEGVNTFFEADCPEVLNYITTKKGTGSEAKETEAMWRRMSFVIQSNSTRIWYTHPFFEEIRNPRAYLSIQNTTRHLSADPRAELTFQEARSIVEGVLRSIERKSMFQAQKIREAMVKKEEFQRAQRCRRMGVHRAARTSEEFAQDLSSLLGNMNALNLSNNNKTVVDGDGDQVIPEDSTENQNTETDETMTT